MGGRGWSGKPENARGSRRWVVASLALVALVALVLLAGCANTDVKTSTTAVPSPTATHAALPTSTSAATVIAIADLATFRASLVTAFTSGKWAQVAALTSPSFTFQGANTGGAQLVMPSAATEFMNLYTSNLAWSEQDAGNLSVYSCFTGNTPASQIMLFGGANNVLAMVGIQQWQGYWVMAWAFQNTRDSSGYCL